MSEPHRDPSAQKPEALPLGARILYALFRLAANTLGRLSVGARTSFASRFGRFAASWIPVRRGVADSNLRVAFPEWGPRRRHTVIAEAYGTIVAGFLDMLAMEHATREDIIERIDRKGEPRARIEALHAEGKGLIIVAAHIGSWEWAGGFLGSIGVDYADIAKPLENLGADRFVCEMRQRFGMKLISTDDSPMRIIRHLKQGGVLSLLSDQNVRKDGVFVPFFGRMASTAPGAGFLAYRLGVPVLCGWCHRLPNGTIAAILDGPFVADRSAPMDAEILRITRLHVESLERAIRREPGQYFWFHRRWKTRPPEERAAGTASSSDGRALRRPTPRLGRSPRPRFPEAAT